MMGEDVLENMIRKALAHAEGVCTFGFQGGEPTLAGLDFFWPRLSPGGAILLHDYNSLQFDGVRKAVHAFEAEHGPLPLLPLSDLHGTAVILRPEGGGQA